jgi:phospholipase/carboxylesterase
VAPERATLVALHGRNASLDQLIPLARSLAPDLRVVAPQASRGVYVGLSLAGHTWCGVGDDGQPEPASFGDSLYQLEQFVYDLAERGISRPVLLGYDLGGVLALGALGVIPDYLSGAIAICGYLPEVPGWSPPMADASGLPVLLLNDSRDGDAPADLVAKTAGELRARGAVVSVAELTGARELGDSVAANARGWLEAVL